MREKVGKLRNIVFFGGSKSRFAKAAGAEPAGQMRDEKLHAVVARSTFPTEKVQSTPWSDHFWKLRCRKSAHRCGVKHVLKSKCTKHTRSGPLLEVEMSKKRTPLWREAHFQVKMYKHTSVGPLLEVEMSKKCTPLWREAHFQVKIYKTHHVRTIFGGSDVEKVHAVVARSTFPSQNVQNTPCTDHFWRFRCRFAWQAQRIVDLVKSEHCSKTWGFRSIFNDKHHYTTLHYTVTTRQYITLHYNYNYTFTTFYYTTLHYTTLHSITLHYTTLHYTTITLHYTPLHYTSLQYTTTTTAQLHSTTLHYTPLH